MEIEQTGYKASAKEWKSNRYASLLDSVSGHVVQMASPITPIELLELGCVYVNNSRIIDGGYKVRPGDLLRVHSNPRRFSIPSDLKQRIVIETQDYIVVDKPKNFPTEPVVDNLQENLAVSMRELFGPNLYPVLSLEIETSGLVVLAKSLGLCDQYQKAFKEGRVLRTYVAYTEKPVRIEQSSAAIRILRCVASEVATNLISEGRSAWSIASDSSRTIFRIEVEQVSGRPSEVRDFLATLGAPILGDEKRGSKTSLKDSETGKTALAFSAVSIRF